MARIRSNFFSGTLSSQLLAGATTLMSTALSSFPEVTGSDVAYLVIDPDGATPEIVKVTAHAVSDTSATVVRGQESTTDRTWSAGTSFIQAPIASDVDAATLAADAAFTGSYVAIISGTVGDGTTDDTDAINAELSGAVAGYYRLRPGKTYLISAPIVVASGQTLDATGATVKLATSSNCNMVQNAAVAAQRRVLDAAMTASSATLTSATASFTSGDVGKAIVVQGAGSSGAALTTTISAYTNSTTVTLGATASTTVSGQYAAIGPRDSNIAVIGGTWDRQSNNSSPSNSYDAHNFRFRGVDGLRVSGQAHASTGGKYGCNVGDCTRFLIEGQDFGAYASDGVHVNGPAQLGIIRNIQGDNMYDDLVSFTARDSTSVITDCAGDITDMVVDTIQYRTAQASHFASALKVIAGKTTDSSASYTVRNLRASRITGPVKTASLVYMGDSSGGNIKDITLRDLTSLGTSTSFAMVLMHNTAVFGDVVIDGATSAVTDAEIVSFDSTGGCTSLTLRNIVWNNSQSSANCVLVAASTTITKLILDGFVAHTSGSGPVLVKIYGTVSMLGLINLQWDASTSGGGTIGPQAGSTLTRVMMTNVNISGVDYPIGVFNTSSAVQIANFAATGVNKTVWARNSSTVTIEGCSGFSASSTSISTDASCFVRSKTIGFPVDLSASGLAKNNGDMAYNTNGALSCGLGPAVSNGSNWKGLYSGSTY